MSMWFRARRVEIEKKALDEGIRPTGLAIARHVGLSQRTMTDVLGGRPVTATTIARFVYSFGGRVEDWFELVIDEQAE